MFDGFLHPAIAFGAFLAAVPLLIHLLNRQRHRPMQWAAMRFVIAAYRRTRRRAHLENLILLLLRMAAVAVLAIAIARPFTGSESPLAALTETRRDLVVVLDGSASTGYRAQVASAFESIVARARQIALELDGGRGDSIRLIYATTSPRLLSWRTPDEALSLLSTLTEPSDERLDLPAALAEVARLAGEDAGGGMHSGLEVHLLTDLQRQNFTADSFSAELDPEEGLPSESERAENERAEPKRAPLAETLDRLHELGVTVLVEDLGAAETAPPNLAIEAVEVLGPIYGPGQAVDVCATVANHGSQMRSGVKVALSIDGERRPTRVVEIPPRSKAKAVFSVAFQESGEHALEASLEPDQLAVDDARAQIIHVPPPVRVLLVNGAPHADIDRDETGLLLAVLGPLGGDTLPGSDEAPPFLPRVAEASALYGKEFELREFDVVVLANVDRLSEDTALRLEEWVAAGGSLMVAVGDRVDADAYNARLFRADGSGLLPAKLGDQQAVVSRRDAYWRVASFEATHPALSFFADELWRPLLTEVPVFEFQAARPIESARVLARLDDQASSPLLVERAYDRGRVFLWLTSIDPDWTRIPESPRTFIPLVHELFRYAGHPTKPARNADVGGVLEAEWRDYPRNAVLVSPDGSRRAIEREPAPAGANLWRLTAVQSTERAGLYRVEVEGLEPALFAVQFDVRESNLERLAASELSTLHPSLRLLEERGRGSRSGEAQAPAKGELWRWFAAVCLAALVLESLWAAWIGGNRSRPA